MPKLDRDQIEKLKSQHSISKLLGDFGHRVRGGFCLCPLHNEKTASCQVFEQEGRFYCHGCGVGGDHFDILAAMKNLPFEQAVESLGGPQAMTDEEREKIRKRREAWEKAEREKKAKNRTAAQQLFEKGVEIKGTLASKYLRNRGLSPAKSWWFDLRFLPSIPYRGFASTAAEEQTELGAYPAMLAAIRDPATKEIIGCHRTYIDKDGLNIVPPGDRTRNKKKKVLGQFVGGLIFLSPPADTLLVGEGIETTRSAFELDIAQGNIAAAAGVNLWNICGSAQGSYHHPKNTDKRVSNLVPDPEKPGFTPPSWAKRIVLCGDGDSEYFYTRAMMGTAAARLKALGFDGAVAMAPKGQDWNSYHREQQGAAA